MKPISLAVVVACLFAGTALGLPPQIQYILELGGNNQEPGWESGDNPPFLPGDPADGSTCAPGAILTWDAVVQVSGSYDDDGNPLTPESESNGAANLVFTLELREWTGTEEGDLVGTQVFFSTMNDGDAVPGPANDPFEKAAFCHIYDVPCVDNGVPCAGNGPHGDGGGPGAGQLFDSNLSGGPGLDRAQYPSTSDWCGGRYTSATYINVQYGPDGVPGGGDDCAGTVDLPPGKLVGMGAGYSQYNGPSVGSSTPGVGISPYAANPGTQACSRGLGHVPSFEGQIDTTALAPTSSQSYILKLIPGTGNNLLRGDFECAYSRPAFAMAVPPENVLPGAIKFWVEAGGPPPCDAGVSQWSSLRNHGAPVYALSVAGGPSASLIETRQGGVQKIVVDFSADVQAKFKTIGDILITKVGDQYPVPPGSCFSVSSVAWPAADQMELTLTPGTHSVACQVDLSSAFTCTGLTNPTCTFHVCDGNINYDVKTDLTDMALSKQNATTVPAIQASARPDYDVNVDNKVDLTDMALIKSMATYPASQKIFCP